MIVKDLLKALEGIDPATPVTMTTFNIDGLEGNKVIDDQNVFVNYDSGVLHISNQEWDDGAS